MNIKQIFLCTMLTMSIQNCFAGPSKPPHFGQRSTTKTRTTPPTLAETAGADNFLPELTRTHKVIKSVYTKLAHGNGNEEITSEECQIVTKGLTFLGVLTLASALYIRLVGFSEPLVDNLPNHCKTWEGNTGRDCTVMNGEFKCKRLEGDTGYDCAGTATGPFPDVFCKKTQANSLYDCNGGTSIIRPTKMFKNRNR